MLNHWWNVTLYVTPRGLTTSAMPYSGGRWLAIDFDFLGHRLEFVAATTNATAFALEPMWVAEFYRRVMEKMKALDFDVRINMMPNEIADAVRFDEDTAHASYDEAYVERFFRALLQADVSARSFAPVSRQGESGALFLGQLRFRGHAVLRTPGAAASRRYSEYARLGDARSLQSRRAERRFLAGRPAAPRPPSMPTRIPSRRVCASAGFAPPGFWTDQLREFLLPYESVRTSSDPGSHGARFLQLDLRGGRKPCQMGSRVARAGLKFRIAAPGGRRDSLTT